MDNVLNASAVQLKSNVGIVPPPPPDPEIPRNSGPGQWREGASFTQRAFQGGGGEWEGAMVPEQHCEAWSDESMNAIDSLPLCRKRNFAQSSDVVIKHSRCIRRVLSMCWSALKLYWDLFLCLV